jgi:hypothetical protein
MQLYLHVEYISQLYVSLNFVHYQKLIKTIKSRYQYKHLKKIDVNATVVR